MEIHITTQTQTINISKLVETVTWSGDYKQSARAVNFGMVSSVTDKDIPYVDVPLGAGVKLLENGRILFDGYVISRTKNLEKNIMNISCFDRGFYLTGNNAIYKMVAETAEAGTARICADYGIEVGELVKTGVSITRNFLTGNDNLYDIIATLYKFASDVTGDKYHIGFEAEKLVVKVIEPDEYTLVIQGKSNLIGATVTESMENVVTEVQIYTEDQLVNTIQDEERLGQFGLLRRIIKQKKDEEKGAEAADILKSGEVKQKITVDALGNIANVTGGCVVVREPHTGLNGLFYIESDAHQWKKGVYYNKLTIAYEAIMSDKEVGTLENANGKKTASKKG